MPCGDKQCESFHCFFLDAPNGEKSSSAATALLSYLDQRSCELWNVAINFIDISHSSLLSWSSLNRLTGRSRHTSRKCPVSANSISSQAVKNRIFSVRDHESAQLMASEVSDLWRVLTPDSQSISSDFTVKGLTSAIQHQKPGKAAGPDSTCPELILHAGFGMKSWLCEFLSSCLRNFKILKILRRALVFTILMPDKPPGYPKSYRPIFFFCVSPSGFLSILFTSVSSPPLTHFSQGSSLVSDMGDQPYIKSLG